MNTPTTRQKQIARRQRALSPDGKTPRRRFATTKHRGRQPGAFGGRKR